MAPRNQSGHIYLTLLENVNQLVHATQLKYTVISSNIVNTLIKAHLLLGPRKVGKIVLGFIREQRRQASISRGKNVWVLRKKSVIGFGLSRLIQFEHSVLD